MSKKIQLSIADPCHENWDKMTPADKGRFCASCQKQVIDFTSMGDSQLAAFFKKPILSLSKDGSVCGRFYNDQLDREIEIPRKRIPWVKYFFQFVLPAFLVSTRATAQGKTKLTRNDTVLMKEVVVVSKAPSSPITCVQQTLDQDISAFIRGKISGPVVTVDQRVPDLSLALKSGPQLLKDAGKITGRVTDIDGRPVAFANVTIKGTTTVVMTNANGEFIIRPKDEWQSVVVVVSSVGFMISETKVTRDQSGANFVLAVAVRVTVEPMVTGVIVCKKPSSKKQSKSKQTTIPVLIQKLMDTAYKFFKIFPNPVSSGASLHIEWKQAEEGYYTFDLIDLSGRKVYSKEIWIDAEARLLNLEVPSVTAGSYFLQATNKNSGKHFTEKIIIE